MADMKDLRIRLNRMVNEHYETPEMIRFLSFPINLARAKILYIHTLHFNINRRSCWAHVQGSCPPDVKKVIWEHEKDELHSDPRFGGDHHTAALQKATKFTGLSPDDLYAAQLIPGCRAAFAAWLHLARHSSWLRAFSASTILERANNNAVVKGGGLSLRIYEKQTEDVLKLLEHVKGHDVHNVADEDHSDMMEAILDRYVRTDEDSREVIIGARDSLDFDRALRGSLAVYMEAIAA